jgi:predicted RNA-binding protein YlxR (DUF448 family)
MGRGTDQSARLKSWPRLASGVFRDRLARFQRIVLLLDGKIPVAFSYSRDKLSRPCPGIERFDRRFLARRQRGDVSELKVGCVSLKDIQSNSKGREHHRKDQASTDSLAVELGRPFWLMANRSKLSRAQCRGLFARVANTASATALTRTAGRRMPGKNSSDTYRGGIKRAYG